MKEGSHVVSKYDFNKDRGRMMAAGFKCSHWPNLGEEFIVDDLAEGAHSRKPIVMLVGVTLTYYGMPAGFSPNLFNELEPPMDIAELLRQSYETKLTEPCLCL